MALYLVKDARQSVDELLTSIGYRVVEDAWTMHGRCTYVHDEDAGKRDLISLSEILRPAGWVRDLNKLRAYYHAITGDEIEVEPGGCEVTGHFLHHMKCANEAKAVAFANVQVLLRG